MLVYAISIILFVSALLLIRIAVVRKYSDLVIPVVSFGPKGLRIPTDLLVRLGLIESSSSHSKFILKRDYISLAIICGAGIIVELVDLGIASEFFQSFLRVANIIVIIIAIIKIFFGYVVLPRPSEKRTDSEIVNEIIQLLEGARIEIHSWDDFGENFKYFAHLLPILQVGDEVENEHMFVTLAAISPEKELTAKAMQGIFQYVQSHLGMVPKVPIPPQSQGRGSKKSPKRKRQVKKKSP